MVYTIDLSTDRLFEVHRGSWVTSSNGKSSARLRQPVQVLPSRERSNLERTEATRVNRLRPISTDLRFGLFASKPPPTQFPQRSTHEPAPWWPVTHINVRGFAPLSWDARPWATQSTHTHSLKRRPSNVTLYTYLVAVESFRHRWHCASHEL